MKYVQLPGTYTSWVKLEQQANALIAKLQEYNRAFTIIDNEILQPIAVDDNTMAVIKDDSGNILLAEWPYDEEPKINNVIYFDISEFT